MIIKNRFYFINNALDYYKKMRVYTIIIFYISIYIRKYFKLKEYTCFGICNLIIYLVIIAVYLFQ